MTDMPEATEATDDAATDDTEATPASAAKPATSTKVVDSTEPSARAPRKVREGVVVTSGMDKTVVVTVEDRVKHALYGKVLRRTVKLKAHDEQNECGIGDRVQIMETRPLSATKRWRVVQIVEKAK